MILSIVLFILTIIFSLFLWNLISSKLHKGRRDSYIHTAILVGTIYYFIVEFLSIFNAINAVTLWSIFLVTLITISIFWLKLPHCEKKQFFLLPPFLKKNGIFYFISFISILIFLTGILYPPNTWDSMTYHLPRVEHWIQNENLSFYSTTIDRQLFSAPFAELSILFFRLLTNNDYLSFSVQWFAYVGSLLVISNICKTLKLKNKQQIYSCLFFATVPIVILEASSTQNDLVVCFWILCTIDRLLVWRHCKSIILFAEIGLAMGLAILTKGTAYVILIPAVLYFAVISIKYYKAYFLKACFTACLCILINVPHYIRSYIEYDTPIEAYPETQSNFSFDSFIYAVIGNFYINVPIPVIDNTEINQHLETVNSKTFPYGPFYLYSTNQWEIILRNIFTFNEDTAINFLHVLLILGALIILFLKRKEIDCKYTLLVLFSFLTFCFCIPWQPWITRLQTPLFALFAPIFGMSIMLLNTKIKNTILFIICTYALLPTLFNYTRPIKSVCRGIPKIGLRTSCSSYINTKRNDLIYNQAFSTMMDRINELNISNLGLIIGIDDFEYPIWRYLKINNKSQTQITVIEQNEHILSDCIILRDNKYTQEIKENYPEVKNDYFLLKLDSINNDWKVIYPENINYTVTLLSK